jgi:fumarate hydratase subunit alpha
MRSIAYDKIVSAISTMCCQASCQLPQDTLAAMRRALKRERSPLGKHVLKQCLNNAAVAAREGMPLCQDCGLAVFLVRQGEKVAVKGGSLTKAINQGVREGHRSGYLRKSCVFDPLYARENTEDNTPAVIHWEQVPGSELEITLLPKGGGAENASRLAMLNPYQGEQGVADLVVRTVTEAGGNPCPPLVIGVGIGGNFERCALLAKKALLRPIGSRNPDPRYSKLEQKLLKEVNRTGVGPQGLGGSLTCLAVHIEQEPCHMSSLPVAVNLNCHVHRHIGVIL